MKKYLVALILVFQMIAGVTVSGANTTGTPTSMAYLQKQYPRLTGLYRPELEKMHTHYIFAVDVSGSMRRYDSIVTPALKAFSRSLPDGEQVTVIPFGTEAKTNVPGLEVKIAGEGTKRTLETALASLYTNEGYDTRFRANTDVAKAVEAVNQSIQTNQDIDMNVVVIITDFLNDLPDVGETPIHSGVLTDLNKQFDNITDGKHTRVVAMKLPPMGTMKGFCLEQLKENVFSNTKESRDGGKRKFDVVDAISDQAAISHWFDQLARDIMTEKLKAVIELDNSKNLDPRFITNIDIDGNTTAEIHWKPNKLYTRLQIDSTYTDTSSDFIFDNNKKAWQTTTDTVIKDIKLGKLRHRGIGLHKYDEVINIGLKLPTEYDDELKRLNIDKPIPDTSTRRSDWLWTFWLSLWVCVAILVLLIVYIVLVAKAAKRNRAEKFSGIIIDFSDSRGKEIKDTVPLRDTKGPIIIGANGTNGCDVSKGNPDWDIILEKKTYSPFLFWKYPHYTWKAKSGYIKSGKKRSGAIGRYRKNGVPTSVNIECGDDSDKLTHGIKITFKKK